MRKLQVQQAQVKSVFSGLKLKSSQQLVPALSESVITIDQSRSGSSMEGQEPNQVEVRSRAKQKGCNSKCMPM